jgi:hypothetical protein
LTERRNYVIFILRYWMVRLFQNFGFGTGSCCCEREFF